MGNDKPEPLEVPDYSWRTAPQENITGGIKVWHIVFVVIWPVFLVLWFFVLGFRLTDDTTWFALGGATTFTILAVVFNRDRTSRFVTWLGLPYIWRGQGLPPITRTLMRPTTRIVVRFLNALGAGAVWWWWDFGLDWSRYWQSGQTNILVYLGLRLVVNSLAALAVTWGLDQFWLFKRTRIAWVVCFFTWAAFAWLVYGDFKR